MTYCKKSTHDTISIMCTTSNYSQPRLQATKSTYIECTPDHPLALVTPRVTGHQSNTWWLPLITFDRFQMGSWTRPLPGGSTGSRPPDSEGMQSEHGLTFGSHPRSPCSAPSTPHVFEARETPTRPLQAASDRTPSKPTNGRQTGDRTEVE
jgi:hypothetical protein